MIFVVAIISVFMFSFLPLYLTHISMNTQKKYPFGFATFSQFLVEWNKKKDDPNLEIKKNYAAIYGGDSFRSYSSKKLYIWAGIIRFDGKCMILDPISWVIFSIWLRLNLKNTTEERKSFPLWNKL